MKKTMRKILAAAMAVIMLFGVMPMAFATEEIYLRSQKKTSK